MIDDNKVKPYTDKQLLDKVRSLNDFKFIPNKYWLLFVRSEEDTPNKFDDKCYLYHGEEFIMVTSCTTNAGISGLYNYQKYNLNGTFIAKSNVWNYEVWKYGLHRSKMPALRQVRAMIGFRDNNRNDKSEEIGDEVKGLYGINFHTVDYRLRPSFWRRLIGGWSVGCFVLNKVNDYLKILSYLRKQPSVSMCILKEF